MRYQLSARSYIAEDRVGLWKAGANLPDLRVELNVVNLGREPLTIKRGDRIAQLVIAPVERATLVEVEDLSQERERMTKAGVEATEIQTAPEVISWFDVRDPDGNSIRWFQVLTTDSKVAGKSK
jgi:hypothetical protein